MKFTDQMKEAAEPIATALGVTIEQFEAAVNVCTKLADDVREDKISSAIVLLEELHKAPPKDYTPIGRMFAAFKLCEDLARPNPLAELMNRIKAAGEA